MGEFSYDQIYGINIDEYCKIQGINIDTLITMIEKDIEILKKNLWKETRETLPGCENWNLIFEIKKTLDKKEKHLKRLKSWRKDKIKNLN